MNDDRQMIVHYNNGTKLELSFPTQIKNSSAAVLEGIKKVIESDKLLIEAEGADGEEPAEHLRGSLFVGGVLLAGGHPEVEEIGLAVVVAVGE